MGEARRKLKPGAYSGRSYWDAYHQEARGAQIDRAVKLRLWLDSFVPLLEGIEGGSILDLGCGSGHDAVALSGMGYRVSGCDLSPVAISEARALQGKHGNEHARAIEFVEHDIATPLPYADGAFDAVVCNLTLHMFTPPVAKDIVDEVRRCLVPGGLFAFHVNATEDLRYRRKLQPPVTRLDYGMFCFGRGQTMRFFSEADCRDLLQGWEIALLEPVQMLRPDGEVQKCALRCAAHASAS